MTGFLDVVLRGLLLVAVSLTHSHAMFDLKEEFLVEVTHVPLAVFGAAAGWARWLELRLPGAERVAGWAWVVCLLLVGLTLLVYREGTGAPAEPALESGTSATLEGSLASAGSRGRWDARTRRRRAACCSDTLLGNGGGRGRCGGPGGQVGWGVRIRGRPRAPGRCRRPLRRA